VQWLLARRDATRAGDEPDPGAQADHGRHGRLGGGGMGTLQALLTEMSGLKKPRGFVNRHRRRLFGMRPSRRRSTGSWS
jgi:hypothetical protein